MYIVWYHIMLSDHLDSKKYYIHVIGDYIHKGATVKGMGYPKEATRFDYHEAIKMRDWLYGHCGITYKQTGIIFMPFMIGQHICIT